MGEFLRGSDSGWDEPMTRPPAGYLPYGHRKPSILAETLIALNGPTRGMITLPHHLDWSSRAEYDLSRPARLSSMYKAVLTEASSTDDLHTWLNRELLLRLWPTLWLPPQLRRRWEEPFSELAVTRINAAAGRPSAPWPNCRRLERRVKTSVSLSLFHRA